VAMLDWLRTFDEVRLWESSDSRKMLKLGSSALQGKDRRVWLMYPEGRRGLGMQKVDLGAWYVGLVTRAEPHH
jgi:hypothetical protein